MKTKLIAILTLTILTSLLALEPGTLIFEDNFERTESQETTDEVGNDWGTNSKSRAKGNKQVDLKDGAMFIKIHPEADHAVSVIHPAEFQDGSVQMRFMLEDKMDTLGLDFADMKFKEVHAGHLFKVTFGTKEVTIDDMKSGSMNMKFYEAKKAKTLTDEQKKQFITSMKKKFPLELSAGKWYELLVTITADKVSAFIDGKEVATLSSNGFAHPTKTMLRLSVAKNAVVDDVKIWKSK